MPVLYNKVLILPALKYKISKLILFFLAKNQGVWQSLTIYAHLVAKGKSIPLKLPVFF